MFAQEKERELSWTQMSRIITANFFVLYVIESTNFVIKLKTSLLQYGQTIVQRVDTIPDFGIKCWWTMRPSAQWLCSSIFGKQFMHRRSWKEKYKMKSRLFGAKMLTASFYLRICKTVNGNLHISGNNGSLGLIENQGIWWRWRSQYIFETGDRILILWMRDMEFKNSSFKWHFYFFLKSLAYDLTFSPQNWN